MDIQARNSVMRSSNCQPIRGQNFSQAKPCNYKIEETKNNDVFTRSDPYTQEQKFDFACRVAALYKKKYEDLQSSTGCYA